MTKRHPSPRRAPTPARQPTAFSRRRLLGGAVVGATAVSLAVAGCSPSGSGGTGGAQTTGSATSVLGNAEVADLVQALPVKTLKPLAAVRLGPGLLPPTNRWFSGLVFGDEAQPVFPLPLSFGLTADGFSFGVPQVATSEKTIAGGFTPDVAVSVGGDKVEGSVVGYDQLSVTVALHSGGTELGRVVIAQGSPYVSYTATRAGTVGTKLAFAPDGDAYTAKAGATTYGLVTAGQVIEDQGNGTSLRLGKGESVTFFAVPADGTAADLAALAPHRVTGSSVAYTVAEDQISTTLTYHTTGGDTAYAVMPHQQPGLVGAGKQIGSYPSVYGTLALRTGTELKWTSPAYPALGALDVSKLSAGDQKELAAQVSADIAATKAFPADTYFGGKALYRATMLWQLADQLGLAGPAKDIHGRLVTTLSQWTDPRGATKRGAFCFVYDDQGKGVVGQTPSFGSDEFNDHHFHYGYFLFTAGVLAKADPSLVAGFAPVMNLLAADIATSGASDYFPQRRNFDAYASHSWASGTAPFADGNNQESNSEAVLAWAGLTLWGEASGNAALATEGRWMLSAEAHAGHTYWTNVDLADPVFKGYGHKIVTLNWGGKRDYATWFSPEPAAMLGILVIPMSPSSAYLAGDPDRIAGNVTEAVGAKFDQKFGDYLLMYAALGGPKQAKAALAQARSLSEASIDDGNSRAYLLAWLMVRASGD